MYREKFIANWHSHTFRCKHASGDAIDYAKEAVAAGITTVGFSEHMPTPNNEWLAVRLELSQMPDYRSAVELVKETYPELKVFYGLECEYLPEWRNYYVEELMGRQECEYLIFGAHNFRFKGELVSAYSRNWLNEPGFVRAYADNVLAGIESGLFKMVAHPDLFGVPYDNWDANTIAATRDIVQAARDAKLPLEINTYGIRKPLKTTPEGERWLYPLVPFWEIAAEEGAHAIINSDAHRPQDMAAAIEPARELAEKSGIRLIMPLDLETGWE